MEIFNGTIALIGLIDGVRAYLRTGQIIPRLVKKKSQTYLLDSFKG